MHFFNLFLQQYNCDSEVFFFLEFAGIVCIGLSSTFFSSFYYFFYKFLLLLCFRRIDHNKLTRIGEIPYCLNVLDASYNEIEDLPYVMSLSSYTAGALHSLNLNYNKISSIPSSFFFCNRNLVELFVVSSQNIFIYITHNLHVLDHWMPQKHEQQQIEESSTRNCKYNKFGRIVCVIC